MIRVLIVDDHPVVRRGLIHLLKDDPEKRFTDIGEAGNFGEVLEKLYSFDFDVVLLDISMPGRNGLEILQEIKKIKPNIHVLILSIYPEEQYAIRMMKLGASGYLNKTSSSEELIKAITKVAQGGKVVSSNMLDKLTRNYSDNNNIPLHEKLSARELSVVLLISSGMKISEIAKELSLSPKTISSYKQRILSKLNLKNTSEIIRYAIREGLAN